MRTITANRRQLRVSAYPKTITKKVVSALVVVLAFVPVSLAKPERLKDLPRDQETGRSVYQEVVEVGGVSAETLFSRANTWIAHAFRSAPDVVKLRDESARRIIVKGADTFTWMFGERSLTFTLTIEVKEGRYRYTINDFLVDGYDLDGDNGYARPKPRHKAAVCVEAMITSLKDGMTHDSPVGDEDW